MTRPTLALAVLAALSAVPPGHAQRAGRSPEAASLPQVQCAAGAARPTTFAVAAQGALNRTLLVSGEARTPYHQQALQQSREGILTYPENAHHYYLAAQAYLGLEDLAGADSMLRRTVEACPGYVQEADAARESGWAAAFQRGVEAFQAGDTTGAIGHWERSLVIHDRRADAAFNLGVVHGMKGDPARAVHFYRRALEMVDRTPDDTDGAVIQAEAETRASAIAGLVSSGATLFGAERYGDAAEVFAHAARYAPASRDAWYNHALALYKLERWSELVPVASRVVEMDPLNYNARIVLFNAHKGLSEAAQARGETAESQHRSAALQTLEAAERLPVHLDGVQVQQAAGSATLVGTVTGANAAAGTAIRLGFTLHGTAGPAGSGTVTVAAPANGERAPIRLEVPVTAPVVGYSYQVNP